MALNPKTPEGFDALKQHGEATSGQNTADCVNLGNMGLIQMLDAILYELREMSR